MDPRGAAGCRALLPACKPLRWCLVLGVLMLIHFAPQSVHAVLIASGDGRGNVTAPEDDPGWLHIGTRARQGMSVVYLGDGWVLTANHVGAKDIRLGSEIYRAVEGSDHRLVNEDSTLTDLLLYRVAGDPFLPDLPRLRIAKTTPQVGAPVLMIGRGSNRGSPIVRQVESGRWVEGWAVGRGSALRWGTNRIAQSGETIRLKGTVTRAISTVFEEPPNATAFEAQASGGDSGGAVFAKVAHGGSASKVKRAADAQRESSSVSSAELAPIASHQRESSSVSPAESAASASHEWELVGVMFAVSSTLDRAADVALFGNSTHSADLAYYRDQILSIVGETHPDSTGANEHRGRQ